MRNTRIQMPRKIIGHTKTFLITATVLFLSFLTAISIGSQLTEQNIADFSIYLFHIFLTLCPKCLR